MFTKIGEAIPQPSVKSPCETLPQVSSSDPGQSAYASQKAALLFGCYRKADANDPEIYVKAVSAVLSEYPVEVIDYVCDPRTGLARRLKWLPTVAEIVEACEEMMRPRREHDAWRERVRKQIGERF